MNTVNAINYNLDQTVRIYDQFYDYDVNVPAADYDLVFSYFKSVMNRTAASNFTAALFKVAQETNIAPIDLLDQFKGKTGVDLTVNLAYYLNQIRSRATLLGVGVPVRPNFYVARNVLQ